VEEKEECRAPVMNSANSICRRSHDFFFLKGAISPSRLNIMAIAFIERVSLEKNVCDQSSALSLTFSENILSDCLDFDDFSGARNECTVPDG